MKLADSNFWLALAPSKHHFHAAAHQWLEMLPADDGVLFCRMTQQSFLRLLTTEAVLSPFGIPPLTNKAAWAAYDGFLADSRVSWANEPPDLEITWKKLASRTKASPKLWMDAYLAAFSIAGGYQLVTTDNAFKQFQRPGISCAEKLVIGAATALAARTHHDQRPISGTLQPANAFLRHRPGRPAQTR